MASKSYEQVKQNRPPLPPKADPTAGQPADAGAPVRHAHKSARQSEFPVSGHGMNQESQHNKHNHPHKGAPKH